MKYLSIAALGLGLLGAVAAPIARPALAGEGVEFANLAPSTVLMISPSGKVSSMKMTDMKRMDMAAKEGTLLTGSVMLVMTEGKLYLIQDKMMPDGKMLSEFFFSAVR
ncbi:MAG: hypothetical protein P4L90_00430 [Rhodopila sp.]|nr:hypothetical protein [Rhodopila sp.]